MQPVSAVISIFIGPCKISLLWGDREEGYAITFGMVWGTSCLNYFFYNSHDDYASLYQVTTPPTYGETVGGRF